MVPTRLEALQAPAKYTDERLSRRACSFLPADYVSWVRRHVPSDHNAADFDSRLGELGLIRPAEALGVRNV